MNKKDAKLIKKFLKQENSLFCENQDFAYKLFATMPEQNLAPNIVDNINRQLTQNLQKTRRTLSCWYSIKLVAAACLIIAFVWFMDGHLDKSGHQIEIYQSKVSGFWGDEIVDTSAISSEISDIELALFDDYASSENSTGNSLFELENEVICDNEFWKG